MDPGAGWHEDKGCLGWFFVPKGQEDSAQGFNPGNGHPWRGALKGRKIESDRNIHLLCFHNMSQSLGPDLGPHHFLHQKSKSIFGVDGSPIAGTRLSDRNLACFGLWTAFRFRSEEWQIVSIFFVRLEPDRVVELLSQG